ncbi:MAG: hypothetical protein PWP27_2665 [Clostridiales bacterium]|jgi:hypothetical protein|nr:hypothetical protein [Clostridiales bacterium]
MIRENKKIREKIGGQILGMNKALTDNSVKCRDDLSIELTHEQLEFFLSCRKFNSEFYKGWVPTVVIPYKNGDIKYIGGVRGLHAHGKGQLYRKGNVPYIEGFFRCGMYLGPKATCFTDILMDGTVEDVFTYIPSMDRPILKEASESIWIVQDVEDYLQKYDISNKIEDLINLMIII